jgi:uncharacterized coiled-coil DUF342 family protein
VYYETTKYVEYNDRINGLNSEIESLRERVKSIDEYSVRIREYEEEVHRLQNLLVTRSREIDELRAKQIDVS